MFRNTPSYSPIARALSTERRCDLQDRQRPDLSRLANGSPQPSHSGGVIGRIAAQQFLHTQPSSGASRIASHAAQAGASNAEITALTLWLTKARACMPTPIRKAPAKKLTMLCALTWCPEV